MTKVIKMALTALCFATFQHGSAIAADYKMQDEQGSAKWTLTLDEGLKPLGEFSSFMLFESEDKSKIARIRFNVCPSKSSFANLFSDVRYKDNSLIAIMQPSSLALGLVAANDDEVNKAKEIIYSINNLCKDEHDAYVAQEKAKEADADKTFSFNYWDCVHPILPFTLLKHEQPNCFIAAVGFDSYKYIGTFIAQFQVAYPELKSEVLDEGYAEFARRIQLAS